MAEFIGEEKLVSKGEPIVFENKTDSSFDVRMGVVFHKSGIYEISIVGNRITVSKVAERKKGRWISRDGKDDCFECSECHAALEGNEVYWRNNYFCYHCGADMRGDTE